MNDARRTSTEASERIVQGLREKAESMRRFRPSQYSRVQRDELKLKAVLFDDAADLIETLTQRLASSYDNEIALTEENEKWRQRGQADHADKLAAQRHLEYHCAGDGRECGFDHAWVGISGHPDDDECSECGQPEHRHAETTR